MITGQYISALRQDGVTVSGDDVYVGDELVVIAVEPHLLHADEIMVEHTSFDKAQHLVRLAVYLDGSGGLDSGQAVRPVLYKPDDLVAAGPPVVIAPGTPAGWVTLRFDPLSKVPAGDYRFGIHAGLTDESAHYYQADVTGSFDTIDAPFSDGPPASIGAGVTTGTPILMFLETLDPVRVPTEVGDDYLARLPFGLTQRVFGAAGTARASRASAVAGWYGTSFDSTDGSHAIVRSDGKLADRVGERLLIRRQGAFTDRVVYVYVHDERTFPDELATEDVLLSGRAFLALGNPGLDTIDVTVETVL